MKILQVRNTTFKGDKASESNGDVHNNLMKLHALNSKIDEKL